MENIDKFDIYSGKILALLLESFPAPARIELSKIAQGGDNKFVWDTVGALREYGVIDFEGYVTDTNTFVGVKLSKRAVDCLRSDVGDKLMSAIKLADDETIKNIVRAVIKG
ncbi:hypothetical protein [uncultured Campylobacter sp.]|uniref:hypothetical protein n=1 Tax=uncultured Campylobacter sp. TaxID=218934 RepID=UPI002630F2F0|nr:hypothetical protein [uncultured Campylobacter sp.]